MMGTKNNPGNFDCYTNADPDEPMFVLLGRDRHAAVLTRIWALLRAHDGKDGAKVEEATACAENMDAWAMKLGKPTIWQGDDAQSHRVQALYFAASKGLDEHPDGFNEPCECDLCLSYD